MKKYSPSLSLRLSLWAKKHPIAARWLIAFSRIAMGYYAFYWGAVLADIDKDIVNNAFLISAFVYLVGFVFYPRKKTKEAGQINFTRQKICDGLVVLSSCAFWLAAGNYTVQWQPNESTETAHVEVLQSAIAKDGKGLVYSDLEHSKIVKKAKKKRESVFKKIKNWRAAFFKKLKARVLVKLAFIKSGYKDLTDEQTILLILASLAIFAGLGLLTIIASCNLSCNGQEGAASVVLLLGIAAIIGSIAWMWSSTIKKNRNKNIKPNKRKKPMPHDPAIPYNTELEVLNPDLKICLETDDPNGVDGVTVSFNGNVLMENIQLGKVPLCVEVSVQPDMVNQLQVTNANGPVKMSIEDGKVLKRLNLPNWDGQPNGVDLILKNK